jgi:hypothetical protein
MKQNNPSFVEWFTRTFNLKSGDMPSNEVLEYITPTIEIKPVMRVKGASLNNNTGATIHTAEVGKTTYLHGYAIWLTCDATSTATALSITATIDGLATQIVRVPKIASVAINSDTLSLMFDTPIKIDAGTNITATSNSNVANFTMGTMIYFHTEELTK